MRCRWQMPLRFEWCGIVSSGGRFMYAVLGSNKEAKYHLEAALSTISEAYKLKRYSDTYVSRSEYDENQDDFLNVAIELSSSESIDVLKLFFRKIEQQARKTDAALDVSLDIDIVYIREHNKGAWIKDAMANVVHYVFPLAELIPHEYVNDTQQRFDDHRNKLSNTIDIRSIDWRPL